MRVTRTIYLEFTYSASRVKITATMAKIIASLAYSTTIIAIILINKCRVQPKDFTSKNYIFTE